MRGLASIAEVSAMKPSALPAKSASHSREVVACVDRSAQAYDIANAAAGLALAFDSPLTLFHVIEPAGGPDHRTDPIEWDLCRKQARSFLSKLRGKLPVGSIAVTEEVVEGERVQAITERGALPGTILVMGAGGEDSRLFFRGRPTQQVLEAAVGPVLIVPARSAIGNFAFERILVPLDGSHLSEAALAEASVLARQTGAELVLAHVVPDAGLMALGPPESSDLELRVRLDRRNERVASDFLEQATRRIAQQGLKVRSICLRGETRTTLQQAIIEANPSLVVLSARGRGWDSCRDIRIGSTASYLLDHLSGPTLVVPASSPRIKRPISSAPERYTHAPNFAA